jgi:hypothetical protein
MHSILCAPHILVCTLSPRESSPLRVENNDKNKAGSVIVDMFVV